MHKMFPAVVISTLLLASLPGCSEQKETKSPTVTPASQTSVPDLQVAFTKVYSGDMDGKYGITMNLTRKGKKLTGSYFYNKVKKTIPISGEISADGTVMLEEKDEKGIVTGVFEGTLQADAELSGKWSKPGGGKLLPFSFKEIATPAATAEWEVTEYSFSAHGKENRVADFSFPRLNENMEASILNKINEQLSVQSLADDTEEAIKKNFAECSCGLVNSNYVVNYNKFSILSITVVSEWLGAYSSFSTKYININTSTGEPLKIEQLLSLSSLDELAALTNKTLQERITQTRKEAAGSDSKEWVNELLAGKKFAKADLQNFTVNENGITFYYPFNFPHAALALEPDGAVGFTFGQLQNYIDPTELLAVEKK